MPIDANDRQAIDDLFARLGGAERQTGPRDAEAEALIRQKLTAQPAAPYYMAQTIVMQEYALRAAQERIEQLERELAERPATGGFLSGLFGGGRSQPAPRPPVGPGYGQQPTLQPNAASPGRGGGFLAGAAQTAMGVAGGVLLGNLIAGMLTSNEAAAATPPGAAQDASPANDAAAEAGGYDELGGDDEI